MQIFGKTAAGLDVHRIALAGGGLTAQILTLGGTVQDLRLEGHEHPLVLGFPLLEPYLPASTYMGPVVGRFANRVANGRASIAGQEYLLDCNFLGRHLLHGGAAGSAQQVWAVLGQGADWVTLGLRMADGDMGFPGNLDVTLTYRLPGAGVLEVVIRAVTDAPTLCNFAHHSYFNLDGSSSILDHELQIAADHYLPVNAEMIPTGEMAPVAGSAFDFRQARTMGQAGANYDHNFCVSMQREALRPVGMLRSPRSGISMQIASTEPGLQVYDAQWMNLADYPTLSGQAYGAYAGVALEPQGWPDAPNHPGFPSAELSPGEQYEQVTQFRFTRS